MFDPYIEVPRPRIIKGINDEYYSFTVIDTLLEFYKMLLGSYSTKTILASTQDFCTYKHMRKSLF